MIRCHVLGVERPPGCKRHWHNFLLVPSSFQIIAKVEPFFVVVVIPFHSKKRVEVIPKNLDHLLN